MSIIRSLCLNARTSDSTQATVTDTSVYGSPNVNRNQEAHWLIAAKMDENEQLVFNATVVPDNASPLLSLAWTFTENIDGAYRFFEFNPDFWSSANDYTAQIIQSGVISVYGSIVWGATTSQFYVCITANGHLVPKEPGVTSGWQTYWQLIPDWTVQILNPLVPVYIFDDVITFRYEDCLLADIDEEVDETLDGVCAKIEDLFNVLSMQLLLDGTRSNNWQNKATRAEVVITAATKKYCC